MTVDALIAELQSTNAIPGVVIATQYGFQDPIVRAWGVDGAGSALTAQSIFPVASVTKIALGLALLRLVDQAVLNLDTPLGTYLDTLTPAAAAVTTRMVMSHTAGYAMDLPNKEGRHAIGLTWEKLRDEALQQTPVTPAGSQVQYSNLGFLVLGALLEACTHQPCAVALNSLVLQPLGIRGWLGYNPDVPHAVIGDVRGTHRGTELETFNSPFWRSLALPSGGLCTDALGALTLVRAYLPESGFLSHTLVEAATTDQTSGVSGGFMKPLWWQHASWGLAAEVRGTKTPHWVDSSFPPESFGHSGASGMIAWADPTDRFAFALLGARVADGGWLLRHGPAISRALRHDAGL